MANPAEIVQKSIDQGNIRIRDIQKVFRQLEVECSAPFYTSIRPGKTAKIGGMMLCALARNTNNLVPVDEATLLDKAFPTETSIIEKVCLECPIFAPVLILLARKA